MGYMSARRLVLIVAAVVVLLVGCLPSSALAFANTGYALVTSFAPPEGFNGPSGLAIDNSMSLSKGDVYVTDRGNDVLDEFSASGALRAQTSVPGVTLGQISVDNYSGLSEGDVYVAGFSNGVIYRFAPGLASREELITGLNEPTDVAIDEAGDLFVSEEGVIDTNTKVLEYNRVGEPINANEVIVGPGENTVAEGAPDGQGVNGGINSPEALAIDANGTNLYIAYFGEEGVQHYTRSGGAYVENGTQLYSGY